MVDGYTNCDKSISQSINKRTQNILAYETIDVVIILLLLVNYKFE